MFRCMRLQNYPFVVYLPFIFSFASLLCLLVSRVAIIPNLYCDYVQYYRQHVRILFLFPPHFLLVLKRIGVYGIWNWDNNIGGSSHKNNIHNPLVYYVYFFSFTFTLLLYIEDIPIVQLVIHSI